MKSSNMHILPLIGLLVLAAAACVPVSGSGASPDVAWNTTLESRIFDEWYDIAPFSVTSYLLVGSTQDYNRGHYSGRFDAWERGGYHWGRDIALACIDTTGTVLWKREIGKLNDDCAGFSIERTPEGKYLIAGIYRIGEADWDICLIETDAGGTMQWMKHYGGLADDWATAGCITNDGFYVMAGGTESYGSGGSDVHVIKTSLNGAVIWKKTFGGPDDEWAAAVCPGDDGGIIIAAVTSSFGSGREDIWILCLDTDGNIVRETMVGGRQDDWPSCIAASGAGGYIVAGGTKSFGSGKSDIFLVKLDRNGTVEWQQAVGGSEAEWARAVAGASDGGYCIGGVSLADGNGNAGILVEKVDARGDPVWDLTFGGSNGDWANAITEIDSNRYLVAGTTTVEKLSYREKIETRIRYISENGYYLAQYTLPYGEIYGQALAAMITVPETEPGTFEDGWDDDIYDATFWEHRIPVFLQEPLQINRTGVPVVIPLREVFGRGAGYASLDRSSIRVIDPLPASPDAKEAGGVAVPYEIHDEDGDGMLSSPDYLVFLSDVPAGCNRTYYVYYSTDPAVPQPRYKPLVWNLLENADFEHEQDGLLTAWSPSLSGYTAATNNSWSGASSLYMHAGNTTTSAAASQWVIVNSSEQYRTLTFVVWASGDEIGGLSAKSFALHPVLVYADGTRSIEWYEQCDVGTYAWKRYAIELHPASPVRHIGYYLLFTSHPGSVWFDAAEMYGNVYDITVGDLEKSTSRIIREKPAETPATGTLPLQTTAAGMFSQPLRSQDQLLLVMVIITLFFVIVVFSLKR